MAGDFSRNKTRNYGMMYLTQSRRDIHQKGLVFGSTKPGLCLEIAGSGEDGSITKRPQCQISLLHGRVQMTRKSIPPKHKSVVLRSRKPESDSEARVPRHDCCLHKDTFGIGEPYNWVWKNWHAYLTSPNLTLESYRFINHMNSSFV